ncbi:tetratricopeptide repeat protein [Flavobacterium sp. GA093]|uniref:Tetratricopeptide repeat protein n=1 Tax=Flavobacterium hydrocarbonoxydans TaxID=2683249 RepID=A0A6I4P173_9FLAO|nr:tetratricopeptide repeat protein [Flavobacterium hydrocarbonoxydans]MWB96854.1 tetratricopeptide repeat protein [Flavobacterium hydrocarbonoxydans]
MISKRIHFPIFIIVLILSLIMHSCQKKRILSKDKSTTKKYNAFLDEAEKQFNNQVYDSAFYYYNKSKLICEPYENEKIIYSLLKMAAIQQIQNDYSGSETSATEAISFFNDSIKAYYKSAIYNTLAINYQNLTDYTNAIYYYNQAYLLAENDLQKAIIKNNIAVSYMEKNDYQQALTILSSLIQNKEILDNPENKARVLDNIGYCYHKLAKDKALDYLSQSLEIRKKEDNNFGMTTSYIHFSEFYSDSNSELAKQYANLAYEKATQVNSIDDRLVSLSLLIKNTTGSGLQKTAQLYLKLNDSITKSRQIAKNQFAKIKYDSKKDREENLLLKAQTAENELQIEKEQNRNLVLSLVVILVLLALLFLYYYLTTKGKREKSKAVYDSETRISKKLHDELANDVYHTMAFAETKNLALQDNKELLLNSLETIYVQTRNISRENSNIDTGENFETNFKNMISSYQGNSTNVIIKDNHEINWMEIQTEKKIALYRVVQELMVNMKKHSRSSIVIIGFETTEKQIAITYSDNGIGFDDVKLKNGLQNAENRILAIKGKLTFESEPNKGMKVKILFPK